MVVSRYADVLREVAPHYGHEEKKMYFPYNYFPGCLPGSNNLFSHKKRLTSALSLVSFDSPLYISNKIFISLRFSRALLKKQYLG